MTNIAVLLTAPAKWLCVCERVKEHGSLSLWPGWLPRPCHTPCLDLACLEPPGNMTMGGAWWDRTPLSPDTRSKGADHISQILAPFAEIFVDFRLILRVDLWLWPSHPYRYVVCLLGLVNYRIRKKKRHKDVGSTFTSVKLMALFPSYILFWICLFYL